MEDNEALIQWLIAFMNGGPIYGYITWNANKNEFSGNSLTVSVEDQEENTGSINWTFEIDEVPEIVDNTLLTDIDEWLIVSGAVNTGGS